MLPVGSMNLKYVKPELGVETDGRASKMMRVLTEGVPVNTNKFEINLYYSAGYQFDFAMVFETFIG